MQAIYDSTSSHLETSQDTAKIVEDCVIYVVLFRPRRQDCSAEELLQQLKDEAASEAKKAVAQAQTNGVHLHVIKHLGAGGQCQVSAANYTSAAAVSSNGLSGCVRCYVGL